MSLNYDFDIFDTGQLFQEHADEIRKLGTDPKSFGSRFALFRDPRTSAALRDADPRVRDCLKNSGFGLNNTHSGAPDGHYLESDEPARAVILGKLIENFEATDFTGVRQGEFDMAAFLLAVESARPFSGKTMRKSRPREAGIMRRFSLKGLLGGGGRKRKVLRRLQKQREIKHAMSMGGIEVYILQIFPPEIFDLYGKDINRCIRAFSGAEGGLSEIDPNMPEFNYFVMNENRFPHRLFQIWVEGLDEILSAEASDRDKGLGVLKLADAVRDTLANKTESVWGKYVLVNPIKSND